MSSLQEVHFIKSASHFWPVCQVLTSRF